MKKLFYLAVFLFTVQVQAQDSVRVHVDLASLTATEKVYNFIVSDFEAIIGWQYRLFTDETKMRFSTIRNPIPAGLAATNFNELPSGEIRSVWIDTDLNAEDFIQPTVIFQLVFEVLEPGGADLCFDPDDDFYQFIRSEAPNLQTLSHLVVSDDCNGGVPIGLQTTSTDPIEKEFGQLFEGIYLDRNGSLSFSSTDEGNGNFILYDLTGKETARITSQSFAAGRNTLQLSAGDCEGIYILHYGSADGKQTGAWSVMAR